MAQALEAAELENACFDKAKGGQQPQQRRGMGPVAEKASEQGNRLAVPSASGWSAEDKALFAEMNEAAGKAMMGESDALVGDLGFSTMDNGKAVGVSWICEFLTEAEFGRVLPTVAKTLTVLMHQLNSKWGNTATLM
jgi:hypothetical protein